MRVIIALAALCLLLLATFEQVLGATIQTKLQGINPVDLVTIGNGTFYITPYGIQGVNAYDARLYCEADNMKLVSFQTADKWVMVRDYLKNNGYKDYTSYWTSGLEIQGIWYWSATGEELTYSNWNPSGEPNGNGDGDCLRFHQSSGWYDDWAGYNMSFICER